MAQGTSGEILRRDLSRQAIMIMMTPPVERLRLDLYLKRSRLVKRRSLAATLCKNGHIKIDGRPAPPGKAVFVGNRIEIRYARQLLLVEVTEIPADARRGLDCHEIISTKRLDDDLVY